MELLRPLPRQRSWSLRCRVDGQCSRINFLQETEMKYMLLIYDDEVVFGKIAKEEQQQILADSVRFTHELHANEQYLSAGPLQPGATAAVVRVRQGKPFVTDGPFAETREQRSEEHTSELQSLRHLVCRLLLEKKKYTKENE